LKNARLDDCIDRSIETKPNETKGKTIDQSYRSVIFIDYPCRFSIDRALSRVRCE